MFFLMKKKELGSEHLRILSVVSKYFIKTYFFSPYIENITQKVIVFEK